MAVALQAWAARFAGMDLPDDIDKPITENEFKDPFGKTNKAIFYLYSLESYLYRRLNWAARTKQKECIPNLGCFAAILSRSLAIANKYREDQISRNLTRQFLVFRGLSLDEYELNLYRKMQGKVVNLQGYASTSKSRRVALDFAFGNKDPTRKSVLFEIDLTDGTISGYCFQMNLIDFTAYPEEDEILLDDGRPFEVRDVVESKEKNKNNEFQDIIKIQLKSKLPPQIKDDVPGFLYS